MSKSVIVIAGILIIGLIWFFHDSDSRAKPVQPEKLNAFISEKGIESPEIVKMSDSKYYVFSSDTNMIYVYEGNGHSQTSGSVPRKGIVFGGLDKGSFGLMIRNKDILKNAYTYNLNIDNETVSYPYSKEKYLVVQDSRIWNPTPQVTITFLNTEGREILKLDF